MKHTRMTAAALTLALVPGLAMAHHGQDFLLVESPSVPHPGNLYLLANADAALDGDSDEQAGSSRPCCWVFHRGSHLSCTPTLKSRAEVRGAMKPRRLPCMCYLPTLPSMVASRLD